MKKIYSAAILGTLLGTMAFSAIPASAQDVIIMGAPIRIHVTTTAPDVVQTGEPAEGETQEGAPAEGETEAAAPAAEVVEKEVDFLRIFGTVGKDSLLIRTDGWDEYVSKEELQTLLPDLNLKGFPALEDVAEVPQGTRGDDAVELQKALIKLKYLEGEADGAYGPGTANAVARFQEEHMLEPTGSADIYTMLLIKAMAKGMEGTVEAASKGYDSPEEKFPQIAARTMGDLNPFLEGRWRFHFDAFEDAGDIDPSFVLGNFAVDSPAIDRIQGTVSIKTLVKMDPEIHSYVLIPALVAETTGAYRPYLQGAILTSDDGTVRIDGGSSTGELDGITLTENGYVPLNLDAMELLAKGGVKTIRLLGKNTTYDVDVTYDAAGMEAFMEACKTTVAE